MLTHDLPGEHNDGPYSYTPRHNQLGGPGDSTALITHYYNNYVGMSVASATPVSIVYTADILSLGTVINWPPTDSGRLEGASAPPAWSGCLQHALYGCACQVV